MGYRLDSSKKGATEHTRAYNEKIRKNLDQRAIALEEREYEEIKKHLIFDIGDQDVRDENGKVLWSRQAQLFLKTSETPDTVNPYLWKIGQETYLAGVFQLSENVYEAVGINNAAIGFVRSENGWIILDTGSSIEEAEAVTRIVEEQLQETIRGKIKAILLSHTHTDHVSGVEAFASREEIGALEDGKIPLIGPSRYEESLIDENLYTGIAMNRRIQYQIGMFLPHGVDGWVSMGFASTNGILGEKSSLLPSELIEQNQKIEIDGVSLQFYLTPETETKSHMCVYIDHENVLYLGDNSVGVMHNTYTMRGAQIRNANYWGKVFYELYLQFGEEVQTIFAGHGLPIFRLKDDPDNLKRYLLNNAVCYKYTHDQALLLANEGYSIDEVGHHIHVPDSIKNTWYTRPHYGNHSFNARGTVQKYLGFYDGNPVNLLPLEKQELAKKIIKLVGDEKIILEKALDDYVNGEYQWVATITNLLVYDNPENRDARYLCADALEQLGYQTDNALWRNAYLSGALELRDPGFAEQLNIHPMDNKDVIPYVSVELILDYLGIHFDGEKNLDLELRFVLEVSQEEKETEYHAIHIYKGTVLHSRVDQDAGEENTRIAITKKELYELSEKRYVEKHPESKQAEILRQIQEYVVDFTEYENFNLIEPIRQLKK